jgi:hypothetical protein
MRKRILTVILVLLLAGVFFAARHLRNLGFIGVGYAAQQTCSCLFVSGRPLPSCRADLDPLAQRIVALHPTGERVVATTILFSATSVFDPVFGCMLTN